MQDFSKLPYFKHFVTSGGVRRLKRTSSRNQNRLNSAWTIVKRYGELYADGTMQGEFWYEGVYIVGEYRKPKKDGILALHLYADAKSKLEHLAEGLDLKKIY